MKRYIHKHSGMILKRTEALQDEKGYLYPDYWVEDSDWSEVIEKTEQEIPIGIVAFINDQCKTPYTLDDINNNLKRATYPPQYKPSTYEDWVKSNLYSNWQGKPSTIHTIKDENGIKWSIGEYVSYHCAEGKIESFEWSNHHWNFYLDRWQSSGKVDGLIKLPIREPIVTLQGKDLFEGDEYWYVTTNDKNEWVCGSSVCGGFGGKEYWSACFKSKELAEQYIIDNKPVIPIGKVDDVSKALDDYAGNLDTGSWSRLNSAIDNLRKYKP